jgi:hypothetical protein
MLSTIIPVHKLRKSKWTFLSESYTFQENNLKITTERHRLHLLKSSDFLPMLLLSFTNEVQTTESCCSYTQIPDFRNEKAGQTYQSPKSYHWGGGGGCMVNHFFGNNTNKNTEINKKNGKIYAKLVAGTENDKHDNNEIIKIENTQENAANRVTRKCDTCMGMDKLIFTFKGNQNLLKHRRVSRALPPSVLAV